MNLFLIKKTYRLRNVDGYQNMSRKQLENIFTTPSASIQHPIQCLDLDPDLDLELKSGLP